MKLTADQLDEIDAYVMRGDTREMRKFLETIEPIYVPAGIVMTTLDSDYIGLARSAEVPASTKPKFMNRFKRGDRL